MTRDSIQRLFASFFLSFPLDKKKREQGLLRVSSLAGFKNKTIQQLLFENFSCFVVPACSPSRVYSFQVFYVLNGKTLKSFVFGDMAFMAIMILWQIALDLTKEKTRATTRERREILCSS